jgi:hypothetical protein
MRVEAGSHRDVHGAVGAAPPGSRGGPAARQSREEGQHDLVVRGIELVAVARFLGSRRFLERAVVGAIGLAALASMARENQARAVARFIAWDKWRSQHPRSKRAAR